MWLIIIMKKLQQLRSVRQTTRQADVQDTVRKGEVEIGSINKTLDFKQPNWQEMDEQPVVDIEAQIAEMKKKIQIGLKDTFGNGVGYGQVKELIKLEEKRDELRQMNNESSIVDPVLQIPEFNDVHSSSIISEQIQTSEYSSFEEDQIAIDANNSTELLFNKTAERGDLLGAVRGGIRSMVQDREEKIVNYHKSKSSIRRVSTFNTMAIKKMTENPYDTDKVYFHERLFGGSNIKQWSQESILNRIKQKLSQPQFGSRDEPLMDSISEDSEKQPFQEFLKHEQYSVLKSAIESQPDIFKLMREKNTEKFPADLPNQMQKLSDHYDGKFLDGVKAEQEFSIIKWNNVDFVIQRYEDIDLDKRVMLRIYKVVESHGHAPSQANGLASATSRNAPSQASGLPSKSPKGAKAMRRNLNRRASRFPGAEFNDYSKVSLGIGSNEALELVKEFTIMSHIQGMRKLWLFASFQVIEESIYFFRVVDHYEVVGDELPSKHVLQIVEFSLEKFQEKVIESKEFFHTSGFIGAQWFQTQETEAYEDLRLAIVFKNEWHIVTTAEFEQVEFTVRNRFNVPNRFYKLMHGTYEAKRVISQLTLKGFDTPWQLKQGNIYVAIAWDKLEKLVYQAKPHTHDHDHEHQKLADKSSIRKCSTHVLQQQNAEKFEFFNLDPLPLKVVSDFFNESYNVWQTYCSSWKSEGKQINSFKQDRVNNRRQFFKDIANANKWALYDEWVLTSAVNVDLMKNEMMILMALSREDASEDARIFFRVKFDSNHEVTTKCCGQSHFNKEFQRLDPYHETHGITYSRYFLDFVQIDEDEALVGEMEDPLPFSPEDLAAWSNNLVMFNKENLEKIKEFVIKSILKEKIAEKMLKGANQHIQADTRIFMPFDYDRMIHLDEGHLSEKRIQEIDMRTEDGADGYDRNIALPPHINFIEDAALELPFVLMFQSSSNDEKERVAFALLKNGKLVPNSFVDIMFKSFCGSMSLTKSSELLQGTRYNPILKEQQDYLVQKYQISLFEKNFKYCEIHEVTVKIFDAQSEERSFQAQISGKKLIITKSEQVSNVVLVPLFKNKENYQDVIGSQARFISQEGELVKSYNFHNPDFCKPEKEFDFQGEFSCNRSRIYGKPIHSVIGEAWLRPEFVQMGDIKEYAFQQDQNQWRQQMLNLQVNHSLNYQRYINPGEYLNMEESDDSGFFVPTHKVFAPCDLFEGYAIGNIAGKSEFVSSIFEHLDNPAKDSDADLVLGICEQMMISLNPVERLIRDNLDDGEAIMRRVKASGAHHDPNEVIRFNIDFMSPIRIACDLNDDKYEQFETLLKLLNLSFMSNETKQTHLMVAMMRATHDYQEKMDGKAKVFDEITGSLALPQQGGGIGQQILMRTIMDDSHIVVEFPKSHTSEVVDIDSLGLRYSEQSLEEILEKKIIDGELLERKQQCTCSCRKKHHFTRLSFFDFREHTRAEKIGRALESNDLDELTEGINYKFDEEQLQMMTNGLLKMCIWAKLDFIEITALRDLINYQFYSSTKYHYMKQNIQYMVLYILPFFAQFCFEVHDVGSNESIALRVLNSVCILQMILGLLDEYQEMAEGDSYLDYFTDSDNLVDLFCTLYAAVYHGLRIYVGKTLWLHPDRVDQDLQEDSILTWMPFLSAVAILLMLVQWFFLLTTFDFMSKWISLLTKGVKDALGFIVLFMIILLSFMFIFTNLGVMFDDGHNYEEKYNTSFNNYPNIPQFMVHLLAAFRSSVGDIQPPNYIYWDRRYDKDKSVSQFYIYIIWLFFIAQTVCFIVFMLNYLIAIVSDSYSYIIENEPMAILKSREEQNAEFRREGNFDTDKSIDIIVVSSILSELAGAEWQGMSKSIKKRIGKLQNVMVQNNTMQRVAFKQQIDHLREQFTTRMVNTENILDRIEQNQNAMMAKFMELEKKARVQSYMVADGGIEVNSTD